MKKGKIIGSVCLFLLASYGVYLYYQANRIYTAEDFGIPTVKSPADANGNGVDDYTDIMLGARADGKQPRYDGSYHEGGYPPDDVEVCTDVVWRAFRYAGYNLKAMVDRDIAADADAYPRVGGKPDPNIDFRRVPNLKVFFERNGESLTLDTADIAAWQTGDIVTYGSTHVAIVSDRRNRQGVPYIIHNGGQPLREEDVLARDSISGHYRFNASLMADPVLWE